MDEQQKSYSTIEEYITSFPPNIQERLELVRKTIKANVPEGTSERISYQMPSFFQNGVLVYYGAYKNHIGFYPTPNGMDAFADDLSDYQSGKGSAQFPHDKPLPLDLIKRIVQFRVSENLKEAAQKQMKKHSPKAKN